MANLNGGYVMINLADTSNLYNLALKAIDANKPIMVYGDDIPYIADSVTADGSSVTITKGGQIIEVASDNTITKTGYKDNMLLSQIVDDDGNARFVEGEVSTNLVGLNKDYGKWSLSGTHLMIVVGGYFDANTTINDNVAFAKCENLPNYIKDKIVLIYPNVQFLEAKTITMIEDTTYTLVDFKLQLSKDTNNNDNIELRGLTNQTITNKSYFRIQIDLLIDTE